MSAAGGDWTLARHMELIPDRAVSCIPQGMRETLVREENQLNKYRQSRKGKGKGDKGRHDW